MLRSYLANQWVLISLQNKTYPVLNGLLENVQFFSDYDRLLSNYGKINTFPNCNNTNATFLMFIFELFLLS